MRASQLEDRVAFTNLTKGKKMKALGKVLRWPGEIIAVSGYASSFIHRIGIQESEFLRYCDDHKKALLYVGGALFGAGVIAGIYGRIQNWYSEYK